MSAYSPPDLLQRWKQDDLSVEQAIGHLLQHLQTLVQRLAEIEKRLRQLEQPPLKPKS